MNELSLATTEDLIQELARRSVSILVVREELAAINTPRDQDDCGASVLVKVRYEPSPAAGLGLARYAAHRIESWSTEDLVRTVRVED